MYLNKLCNSLSDLAVKYGYIFSINKNKCDEVCFERKIEDKLNNKTHINILKFWLKYENKTNHNLNWWLDCIFDDKHDILVDGYPSNILHTEPPINEAEFLKVVEKYLKNI